MPLIHFFLIACTSKSIDPLLDRVCSASDGLLREVLLCDDTCTIVEAGDGTGVDADGASITVASIFGDQ